MLGKSVGRPLLIMIDQVSHTLFGVIGIIMKAAPIGAFGAMAFTIGKFGLGTLTKLGMLMGGLSTSPACCSSLLSSALSVECVISVFSNLSDISVKNC